MAQFPLFLELEGRVVLLIGHGPQTEDKLEKLRPFGAEILRLDRLREEDLERKPALVVAGDLPLEESEIISRLCIERNIPVNVVDVPRLCSFYFPAMVREGDLTVAIGTGGKSPAFAMLLKRRIREILPKNCGELLNRLGALRGKRSSAELKELAREAFEEE